MTAEQFYKSFCKALRENLELTHLPWSGEGVNRKWTDLILREKDGVLFKISDDKDANKDADKPLLYAREWMHIDGIFYKASETSFKLDEEYWSGYQYLYRVVIEVENNYKTFRHEVCKLTHFNCPLKVGITYVKEENEAGLANLKKEIGHIMQESHKLRRELDDTKYLFIAIREPEKADPIKIVYDSKGEEVTEIKQIA